MYLRIQIYLLENVKDCMKLTIACIAFSFEINK
jgi:hypothetical protein